MATEMTEERLREIEAGQCVHDIDDDAGSVMCKACRDRLALIAALRQAWQERDIEAKAALACNDALVRERAALAAAQAERDALLRSVDMEVTARRNADAALTEARRVLREVEWSFDNGYDSEDACPICQQPRSTSHVPDCALAAVLAQ